METADSVANTMRDLMAVDSLHDRRPKLALTRGRTRTRCAAQEERKRICPDLELANVGLQSAARRECGDKQKQDDMGKRPHEVANRQPSPIFTTRKPDSPNKQSNESQGSNCWHERQPKRSSSHQADPFVHYIALKLSCFTHDKLSIAQLAKTPSLKPANQSPFAQQF